MGVRNLSKIKGLYFSSSLPSVSSGNSMESDPLAGVGNEVCLIHLPTPEIDIRIGRSDRFGRLDEF